MKANITMSPWIVFLFIVIMVLFLLQGFDLIDVITIIGVVLIVTYYVLGFIRRKDALVITDDKMIVKTPIKTREFDIKDISMVQLSSRESGVIKALYKNEVVTLCSNIYSRKAEDILQYLITTFPHIKETHQLRKDM
ncbi:hypothetical protein [Candidatus Xianfuyuplasma coldseepsis]|uniref:DUF304 domain-containing protein n=1 Tax=Candidatus Xianfuyuplasma coldseepsis TaxID=2782163 RepID=A0A7L7KQG8_9MOLU|nr:hypothetical protein [Xianfuyuplasma coldseepsis]QMS85050.1 hypothetical protein G4Z02_04600 [Xianfuyuplasma coldseepsis]